MHHDDLAVLFPGQGSHTDDDRAVVERHAPDLLRRCLDLVGADPFARAAECTRFAQPAIFCASLAHWRASGREPQEAGAMAGHSLGELSALAAAGVLDEHDALRLVVLRGSLMAGAAAAGTGGMLALRATVEQAEAIAEESGATVANDNAPGQVVLAGDDTALAEATDAAIARSVRSLRLPVAGAFHSPVMGAAAGPFARALAATDVRSGDAVVLSGVTAEPFTDVRGQLVEALTSRVRWREVLLALHERGARRFVDVGPGQVLAGLVKRTVPQGAHALA